MDAPNDPRKGATSARVAQSPRDLRDLGATIAHLARLAAQEHLRLMVELPRTDADQRGDMARRRIIHPAGPRSLGGVL